MTALASKLGSPTSPARGDEARWAALRARDVNADGTFVYSVKTTGVYCRPSCPARPARPENVAFHATPSAARAAGFRPCKRCKPDLPGIQFAHAACQLGTVLVAATARGVCAILLGDRPAALTAELAHRFPGARRVGAGAGFESMVEQVVALIEHPARGTELPLDIRGTPFQQRVWSALRRIPAGQTASYTDIARAIGQPRAVRAVAQACGANALAVAIPCHRVVRADGDLSGYRWGAERKRALLAREVAGERGGRA